MNHLRSILSGIYLPPSAGSLAALLGVLEGS
jgi:hypothetical protein